MLMIIFKDYSLKTLGVDYNVTIFVEKSQYKASGPL